MAKPEIRLKGFEGEWIPSNLGTVAPLVGGYAFQSGAFAKSGIPIVRISNILDTGIVGGDFAKCECFKGDKSFRLFDGDIVIAMSGATTGKTAIVKTDKFLYQNQRVGKFSKTNKVVYPFVSTFVGSQRFINALNRLLTASAQPNASSKDVDSVVLNLPKDSDEQQVVSSYFQHLDSLIQSTSRKMESLKQMKQACLVSMFPQAGETTPRVRFKGFEGKWTTECAGHLFNTFNDRNRPDLPVLSANQDIRGMAPRNDIGYQISHNRSNEVTYKVVRPGQFVIHLRSFQGGFAHSSVLGITSPAYTVFGFKNSQEHDDYFWKIIFMSKEFIKNLETITYGIRDGKSISFTEFSQMKFLYPSKDEQQRIASYFRSLDKQISLQEKRLEKLKQIKAACLDKMFV